MPANNLPSRMGRRQPPVVTPAVIDEAEIELGLDPDPPLLEVPKMDPAPIAKSNRPFRVAPKPFPHRLSLDLDEATYSWLRDVAHENRVRMGPLVRELLSAAKRDQALLEAATERVKDSQ